ncbi:LTA synthase family protein [Halosquirtibacter laminarini]|uniref:LTA synthase family protein n=1 Tax=Halosquirtibacter laminarini TaxID=3374600 RepID=A0AC61NNV0_9BACT|nr:LTA synthase family protein [Prolixibacteraceae bacterium]
MLTRIEKSILKTKSLAPILTMALLALAITTIFRLAYMGIYWDRIVMEPQLWKILILGLRIDLIPICYFSILPTLIFLCIPKRWILTTKVIWNTYLAFFITIVTMMELATYAFIEQYDLRPDRIFIEYLDHMKEVSQTVIGNNPISVTLTVIITSAVAILSYKLFSRVINNYEPFTCRNSIIAFPLVGGLVFMGARSSFSPRPANISTAYFSNVSKMANELSLNSTFSVFCACLKMKDEKDPSRKYGKMEFSEIVQRIEKTSQAKWDKNINSKIPFFHKQQPTTKSQKPQNIVIFLQESLGAEYVGCLGGLPLTPNIDRLSKEGTLLTNLYSTGTRTVRGIEGTVAGFLPTPGRSVVKLGKSRNNFFTIAALLESLGYDTNFVYGGMSNFDDMKTFFKGNGIQNVYDEDSFKNPKFKGTWGVCDEDLVVKANEVFKSKGDKPFFALMLSTSNHAPFEYPSESIELYDKGNPATVHNAMKYADYAIGKLFELAKKEEYYKNTIFVVIADHNTRTYGDAIVPVNKFHIPALFIGPNVPAQRINTLASQIDIAPTILSLAGVENNNPMIGNDLTTLPEDKGRAIMQYGQNHAYRVGDKVVIHQPNLPAKTYSYKEGELILIDSNKEMERDGLAYSLLPWYLYSNRLYTLKKQDL